MKKLFAPMALVASVAIMQGCAAVAVGGYVYSDTEDEKNKQAFLKEFDAQNLEREKAGLEPKDLCEALKRRNIDWWEDDPVCNP